MVLGAILLILPFFNSHFAYASTLTPVLLSSDRQTGELTVCYENVPIGKTVYLYERKYSESNIINSRTWVHDGSSCKTFSPYENGQTVFYYIRYLDGTLSPPSNTLKQTPPITSIITNFDELTAILRTYVDEIIAAITALNDNLTSFFESMVYPSDSSLEDLTVAITDLKNALGINEIITKNVDITNSIDTLIPGLESPFLDDGIGTFTGGANPNDSPFNSITSTYNYPDISSGTDTPISFTVPITLLPDGSFMELKIFSEEQLEKFKWLGLIRDLIVALMWISFAVFIIVRFTPTFKV